MVVLMITLQENSKRVQKHKLIVANYGIGLIP